MTSLWQGQKAGRALDKSTYQTAEAKSETKFVQYKFEQEKKYWEKANAADARYDARYDELSANFMQYASKGTSGQPIILQTGSGGAKGADGPSPSTLVPITYQDGLICAENTARLLEAHKWAIDLNK
jgi:hypothetical protein